MFLIGKGERRVHERCQKLFADGVAKGSHLVCDLHEYTHVGSGQVALCFLIFTDSFLVVSLVEVRLNTTRQVEYSLVSLQRRKNIPFLFDFNSSLE